MSPIIKTTKQFFIEESVLEVASQDSLSAMVPRLFDNLGLRCNLLDLVKLGLVLADIGRVGLAGVSESPSIATCGLEAARLVSMIVSVIHTRLELLVKWDEEASRCATWN